MMKFEVSNFKTVKLKIESQFEFHESNTQEEKNRNIYGLVVETSELKKLAFSFREKFQNQWLMKYRNREIGFLKINYNKRCIYLKEFRWVSYIRYPVTRTKKLRVSYGMLRNPANKFRFITKSFLWTLHFAVRISRSESFDPFNVFAIQIINAMWFKEINIERLGKSLNIKWKRISMKVRTFKINISFKGQYIFDIFKYSNLKI